MQEIAQLKTKLAETPELIKSLDKNVIIDLLRDDEIYYGEAGKQFLSASFLGKLIKEPWNYDQPMKHSAALTIGQYFHVSILEPEKLDLFTIVDQARSSSKKWHIAQKDVDMVNGMSDKVLKNSVMYELVRGKEGNVTYEEPGLVELAGVTFKGKADILNHEEKLVVDLKSTSDLDGFKWSAKKFGYTSQAYIYQEMFGYEMVFVVVEKNTNRLGVFTCSDDFISQGKYRLEQAVENYKKIQDGYDWNQEFVEFNL